MFMVIPTLAALWSARYAEALAWFCLAGLSDGLDGFLAKRFDWRTRLGGLLDPLADKLLLVSVYASLTYFGLVPPWLLGVVLGRDLVIVTGGLVYNTFFGPVQPEPSRVSKLNTLLQLGYAVMVIGRQVFALWPAAAVTAFGAAVFVTSIVSGLDYVIRWSRRAAGQEPAPRRA
jgi:cardiolipin synthase